MAAAKPDMKKYRRERPEKRAEEPGVIRVTPVGVPAKLISKTIDLLEAGAEGKEGAVRTVTLLGSSQAIGKIVKTAEVVRRRVKGVHTIQELTKDTLTTKYVPKKEGDGLEPFTREREVSGVKIVLSLDALDAKASGYSAPLDDAQVQPEDKSKRAMREKGRGRGRGAGKGRGVGGRGKGKAPKKDEWAWLPVRRGGGGVGGGRARGLPSRGGGRQLPSRGGGGGHRSRGGGGGGQVRSRGGGGGGRIASRGGGIGGQVRSRGGGGYQGPPRSRGGGGRPAPPRSRGAGVYGAAPRSRGGHRAW